jgi:GxxExxY protein
MIKQSGLTEKIIGAAIEVHKALGPGLLESTYQKCLAYELMATGIRYRTELDLPVMYKGTRIDCGYRIDFLVEDTVIVELKSVETLLPVHQAQLLTYMKLANKGIGLLINFNSKILSHGIKRFVL